jgi:hypothetical protein
MSTHDTKEQIYTALAAFSSGNLRDSACGLLNTLGYTSTTQIDFDPNNAENFIATFDLQKRLNTKHALLDHWQSINLLFQLTSEEVIQASQGQLAFNGGRVDNSIIESYLFFAIDLAKDQYTRTQLASITREVNKLFPMPALLLCRHGERLTLAIINRRLSKRDDSKDVLEKVTMVKDIAFADPLRAHIDILYDLSLPVLYADFRFHNFVGYTALGKAA